MNKDHRLLDGISDMIFVVNVLDESVFVYDFINQKAMKETGLSHDVLGKRIQDVYPYEVAHFLINQYKNVLTDKSCVEYEDAYVALSGEKYYSSTKLHPIFDDHQKCVQILAIVKDITKQKVTEVQIEKAWTELSESRQRYESLFQFHSDAVLAFDLNGCITNGNIAVEKVTGYQSNELIGRKLDSLFIGEDFNKVEQILAESLEGDLELEHTYLTIRTKDQKNVVVSVKVTPLTIDNKVTGLYGILKDVTKLVKSMKKLQESEERFRIIAENANDLITLINERGEIIYASPSYKDVLGHDYNEFVGKFFLHNVHPVDKHEIDRKVIKSIRNGEKFQVQFRQYNPSNKTIWTEAKGSPVFDEQGKFKHMVVITRDISMQREYESQLEYFAHHDSLTGLPNRRLVKKQMEDLLATLHTENKGFAVIMLDIDDFKGINDQLGHDVGDGVIVEFGKRISKSIGVENTVGRLGGDEFIILLPDTSKEENALFFVQSIQKAVQIPWVINGHSLRLTTSMGITLADTDSTYYSLLKDADKALYDSKNNGKDSYSVM
ncbi:PAS domain S-box-containing protein/diguanylate cyclase (GGDEF) domain-containing protein [Oceanobacillus limi]|uniref:PAS domain S-box-containing protein/diguanylate cyclase (GGDEF) domain-containing protein n=1 Tax=Oceanobacillus limi TaxID=930131 RepID=A0A1I0HC80_9BACI|nr:PAS domain S-box protein [Oceanobacillus limi]SET80561.1 PAS domain S-box-containing protein/diguanylate cyclase (GGDEF) domain-containing protein [Oceanobacillus limi]